MRIRVTVSGRPGGTVRVSWGQSARHQTAATPIGVYPSETTTQAPKVRPAELPAGLTIGATGELVTHPGRGLYPTKSNHRSEVLRALAFAVETWGVDRVWSSIRKADLKELWRKRLENLKAEGFAGARGAESTIGRILTIASWLRDEELIPADACMPPRNWKQLVREEAGNPDTHRPRYTLEEMRQLLALTDQVDPRLGLLCSIGAELRLGQVLRLRRPDVDLPNETVRIRGRGHKQGTLVQLTAGQLRALRAALETGYLRQLEGRSPDYHLFPGGRLIRADDGVLEAAIDRTPIGRRAVGKWWYDCEELAGIEHVEGRGPYGIRRAAVDGFLQLGISAQGLQRAGGWSDITIPNQVYADKESAHFRQEAADKRALLRGEVGPPNVEGKV